MHFTSTINQIFPFVLSDVNICQNIDFYLTSFFRSLYCDFFSNWSNFWWIFFFCNFSISFFFVEFLTDKSLKSGLLENDDIVVSRRANSYVLTAVAKTKIHNLKKANGLETMLKKAGAGNYKISFFNFKIRIDCLLKKTDKNFLVFFHLKNLMNFDCLLIMENFFSKFTEGVTISPVKRSQNAASDTEKEADISFISTSTQNFLYITHCKVFSFFSYEFRFFFWQSALHFFKIFIFLHFDYFRFKTLLFSIHFESIILSNFFIKSEWSEHHIIFQPKTKYQIPLFHYDWNWFRRAQSAHRLWSINRCKATQIVKSVVSFKITWLIYGRGWRLHGNSRAGRFWRDYIWQQSNDDSYHWQRGEHYVHTRQHQHVHRIEWELFDNRSWKCGRRWWDHIQRRQQFMYI